MKKYKNNHTIKTFFNNFHAADLNHLPPIFHSNHPIFFPKPFKIPFKGFSQKSKICYSQKNNPYPFYGYFCAEYINNLNH